MEGKITTGRVYSKPQEITWKVVNSQEDEGIYDLEIDFEDQSRNIAGKIFTCVFDLKLRDIEQAIMVCYDTCHYTDR